MEALRGAIGGASQLLLIWQGREIIVEEGGLIVGRGYGADLRLRPGCVSRIHAQLALNSRSGQFELIDRSTNGTYLQTEDGHVRLVHRQRVPLWGEGIVSFGEPLTEERAVRFKHV